MTSYTGFPVVLVHSHRQSFKHVKQSKLLDKHVVLKQYFKHVQQVSLILTKIIS